MTQNLQHDAGGFFISIKNEKGGKGEDKRPKSPFFSHLLMIYLPFSAKVRDKGAK